VRDPRGRDARDAAPHGESVLLEDLGQVARGLDFLEPQFAEAEDRDHDLRLLGDIDMIAS
jgi:hypothetical protein